MKQLILLIVFPFLLCKAQDATIYLLLEKGTHEEITTKLDRFEQISSALERAYKGALLCKKANTQKQPKLKLADFKKGALLIEEAVKLDSQNVEIRFLRYIIQVSSPKFLGYKESLQEDKKYIEKKAESISKELKTIIKDFNESSSQIINV